MRILLAIALVALAGCDYEEWSAARERNANLSYGPWNVLYWQYLNDGDVQYSAGDSVMFLQKVKSKDHVIAAYLDEDGFNAFAFWKADCEEDTEIETSKSHADGLPKMLRCQRYGDSTWLVKGALWRDRDEPSFWTEDFDGFEVSEDFTLWDWTKAKQYATLQKAKPADPQDDE